MENKKLNSNHKPAFTLAEVLITLSIIGVVAAITIPTLIGSYQKRVYITSLRKAYNETTQAITRTMSDKQVESFAETGINSKDTAQTWVTTYFKTIKTCDSGYTPCFATAYSGDNKPTLQDNTAYIIASGASIGFSSYNPLKIVVDTNGEKKPNISGRDLFEIQVDSATGTLESPSNTSYFKKILDDNWQMKY